MSATATHTHRQPKKQQRDTHTQTERKRSSDSNRETHSLINIKRPKLLSSKPSAATLLPIKAAGVLAQASREKQQQQPLFQRRRQNADAGCRERRSLEGESRDERTGDRLPTSFISKNAFPSPETPVTHLSPASLSPSLLPFTHSITHAVTQIRCCCLAPFARDRQLS